MNKFAVVGLAALAMVLAPALVKAAGGSGARIRFDNPPSGAITPVSVTTPLAKIDVLDGGVANFQGQVSALGSFVGRSTGTPFDATLCATGQYCLKLPNNTGLFMSASDTTVNLNAGGSAVLSATASAVQSTKPWTISGGVFNTLAIGTAGSGTGFTTNSTGAVVHQVHKITVTEAALDAAATSDETIWTVAAKTRVLRVIADVTATFANGGITDMDVTCGTTAGGNQYLISFDVDTATGTYGDAAAEIGAGLLSATVADIPSWSGTTAVQCRFTCAGANCDQATTGSVTFYIEHLVYP